MSKQVKNYIEHPDKAVETDGRFEHVMAIALDPHSYYKEGVIRCIESRSGDVAVSGYIDRSALHMVHTDGEEHFSIGERLVIKNQDEIIEKLGGGAIGGIGSNGAPGKSRFDFLGLEDPDIWIDKKTGLTHLYFTMPFRDERRGGTRVHLGHAAGKSLRSLEMTMPVLMDDGTGGAKEVSIAPRNKQGFHYNLVESSGSVAGVTYSTIRTAFAEDMGAPWQFGDPVFHPAEHAIPWVGGHASPGPLFPKSFIDVGAGKLLGVMNGREANRIDDGKIKYGMFSVGLFIYDYGNGIIDWVSPEPFIQDSQAKTITFASQFVETGKGKGTLYAHVDDSFVRGYTLEAWEMKMLVG